MPDWSYHVLFKPVLSYLPSHYSREFIHRGMNQISSVPGGHHIINFLGREESSPLLEKEIDTIRYSNSIGLSGKVDPLLTGTKAFSNLGFGFIEIGPVTVSATSLTPPSVYKTEQIIEFPQQVESIGLKQTITSLNKLKLKQPLMIRLAGSFEDQVRMIKSLDQYADAFILDSPFTLEQSAHFTTFTNKPVYLSIRSGDLGEISLTDIQTVFSGIVLDEIPNKRDSINLIEHTSAIKYLRENDFIKTIITVGGILEPGDALKLLDAGVDLVTLSGGYVFSGPGLSKRIKEAQLYQLKINQTAQEGWG